MYLFLIGSWVLDEAPFIHETSLWFAPLLIAIRRVQNPPWHKSQVDLPLQGDWYPTPSCTFTEMTFLVNACKCHQKCVDFLILWITGWPAHFVRLDWRMIECIMCNILLKQQSHLSATHFSGLDLFHLPSSIFHSVGSSLVHQWKRRQIRVPKRPKRHSSLANDAGHGRTAMHTPQH